MPVKFVMNAMSTSWSSSNAVMLVLLSAADLYVVAMVEAPVMSGCERRCLRSTKGNGHRSHTITLDVNIYFSEPKMISDGTYFSYQARMLKCIYFY